MSLLRVFLVVLALLPGSPALASATYRVDYTIELEAGRSDARVSIRVSSGELLKRLRFTLDPERHRNLVADGRLELEERGATWHVPPRGGTLRLDFRIPRQRRDAGYDALVTRDFAIFRGDHAIPPATAVAEAGAESRATLRFVLPKGWSVDTGWPKTGDGRFRIDNPERRFDRPTGWTIAGRIGVRRDRIGATEIAVAAPVGQAFRRMDFLTFLNFVWPEFDAAFGVAPPKLLLVGAGDPMWRGGLSAPNSIFLHAERPIVSENGTSTLLHELFHVVTRIRGAERDDWIAEGLAEYYAVELMRRAGGLSETRHDQVRRWLEDFGREVRTLKGNRAAGPMMARAAILFWDLDRELRAATGGQKDLDDVVRELIPIREVSEADLRRITTRIAGRPPKTLDTPLLR
jgi:predicted metalloprotease with PDZ domain